MFHIRDYSLFSPSPGAPRVYARVRQLDIAIRCLFAALLLASIWNISQLVQMRLVQNQDFASIRDIADDPSTRVIWILVPVTLVAIGWRERISGDLGLGLIYPLGALLAIVLIPAAMTEIQPKLIEHPLHLTVMQCPARQVVNGELRSVAGCDPLQITDGDVLLATANPLDGAYDTLTPTGGGQNTIAFTVQGRGTYTLYFMFRSDSMEACARELVFPKSGSLADAPHTCVERDGTAYLVMPYTTSGTSVSGINLIRVRPFA